MDISTVQIAVYICVIMGALFKIYSKGQQLGGYDFFTKAHLTTLVIALAAVIYVASQAMSGITIPASLTGLTLAFLVTAILAGWAAGDLAYNTALVIIADLKPAQPAATSSTPPSAQPTA
jgi:hypothetical protein